MRQREDVQQVELPEHGCIAKLIFLSREFPPMRLLNLIICVIVGAGSSFAFGDWVQAHNPFTNDFRVQAYAIPFVAGVVICRLLIPTIGALAGRHLKIDTNR
ncbi:hypothetical protein [Pseudomonas putida]|uniref:Uncharacterized protein n=1 Tax=Pseudomonas putida TaxID=303 RepID=A0A7V8EAQ3_PSEPU|nr:hypothetical protein [Pseudomonas putida]KAF0251286.1 hypothetical protein GN299_29370 [Pseudomonas putida]